MKARELKVGDNFRVLGVEPRVHTCTQADPDGRSRGVASTVVGYGLGWMTHPDADVELVPPEAKTAIQAWQMDQSKERTAELLDSLRAEHLSDYLAKRTQQFSFFDWLMEVAQDGHQEADEYLGMSQQKRATSYTSGGSILEHRLQRMGMETPNSTTPPAPGKTINIWKAQPFTKDGSIESLTINLHETIPEVVYSDLDEWRMVAKKEAVELCDALCSTMPQGVVDALLVELLDRKRSLFVVPMNEPAEKK